MAVLYKKDIREQNVDFQYETKNMSFLRLAMVLKKMGIENHLFHLSLLDPELKKIDPHSKNLGPEEMARILRECKLNPWYFFREIIRIQPTGGELIPFELHRANLAAIWTFFNDIDFGLVQPRQTGKTYVTQSIFTYVMFILAESLDIGMFTKDTTLVQDNTSRLKSLRDCLPPWMIERSGKDWDRKEGVSYYLKNNYYKTFTSANDERGAYKLGRGATMGIIHFDEIAFINYNWLVVPTAVNSMLKASEQARKNGIPSPIIYTTTAGNPDTREGAFALSIFESALPFTEKLYDLNNRDELVDIIDKSATRRMLYLEFSYRQLGKTDEWFKIASSRSNGSQDDINRDLLNIWQSSTDKAIIPQTLLSKMRASRREPDFVDISDGFLVRWYLPRVTVENPEFAKRSFVMGMDTSENVGRDFTTFVILDPSDMSVVATCRCNDSNTIQIARHVVVLLKRYPGLVWIPERNNTGVAIIDFVMEQLQSDNINPFFRIYNEVVQNNHEPKFKDVNVYSFREIYGKTRSTFGFRTAGTVSSGTSRNILYKVTMMKTLEMNYSRLFDNTLVSEFCNLTERNGRVDHLPGLHDDTVIAYLLACYLLYFGKNLRLYGINESSVLSKVTIQGTAIDPRKKMEQIELRRRIQELKEKIEMTDSFTMKELYKRELNSITPLLEEDIVNVKPLAVAQMEHQKKDINRSISGDSLSAFTTFSSKFSRGVSNFYNRNKWR